MVTKLNIGGVGGPALGNGVRPAGLKLVAVVDTTPVRSDTARGTDNEAVRVEALNDALVGAKSSDGLDCAEGRARSVVGDDGDVIETRKEILGHGCSPFG